MTVDTAWAQATHALDAHLASMVVSMRMCAEQCGITADTMRRLAPHIRTAKRHQRRWSRVVRRRRLRLMRRQGDTA